MSLRILVAAVLTVVAVPLAAENRALVIGNEDYSGAERIRAAADVADVADALGDAGFNVILGRNLGADNMRVGLGQLLDNGEPDRMVIVLAGHFAHRAGATWFLGIDADRPSLALVDGYGLPLVAVLETAAFSPGGAVVLLGTESANLPLGAGLAAGFGPFTIPQGVTVITGDTANILAFAENALTTTDTSLPDLLAEWPDLVAEGFLSRLLPFLPEPEPVDPAAEAEAAAAEREVWEAARETGTVASLEAYLARYPNGTYAADARREIARVSQNPERLEAGLGLTASQRREIQRQLTLLGFSTRGIDGIFGPGTRTAITNWQRGRGLSTTSFLDADQVAMLRADAAARQAQIDEEQRQQQIERERADRAFWRDTGQGRDEAGLRAYLDRYPNGLFADVARVRLGDIVARRDRDAWDEAQRSDSAAAYRRYLSDYPEGQFAARARARLDELTRGEVDARDRAAWDAAQRADTAAAYRRYLSDFPNGQFAVRARTRLDELTRGEVTARDRAAWEDATARDTADAYRRYLDAFPNGAYSDSARRLLAERLAEAGAARDLAAWDAARAADTAAAYRGYLGAFPDGRFAREARSRLEQLTEGDNAAARAAEEALNLNSFARRLVESQIQSLGFNPGAVDGQFDADTRRAFRQYQESRGMPVTGYMSNQMLMQMVSEGLQFLPF